MRVQLFRGQTKVVVQKSTQIGRAVGGMRNHFHAIAGGKNQALFDSRVRSEIAACIRQLGFRDRQALPHFQGRAVVIHADELVSHEATNLWMVEK